MASRRTEFDSALAKVEQMAQDAEPYEIEIDGKVIPVLPGVFSPKYFSDVDWFAREIPTIVSKRSLLEIGTGTGVIALFAALGGARKIVATDINPVAVKNARKTFRLHKVHADIRCGDVFEAIKPQEKFDIIFWNHPFFCSHAKSRSMLMRGAFDYKYASLRAFFARAKAHLAPGGEVLLGTSKTARIADILKLAKEYGYIARLLKKETIPSKHHPNTLMDVRLYSFRHKLGKV